MKKALSIIFLLLFASPLLADTVSSEKALEIAKTVLGGHPSIRSNVPHPSISVVQDEDLFIVNREGGGFVLVAANDDVRQVLGFSYDNNFVTEEMPDNVRFFLDYIKGYCRSGGKGVRAALNQNLITGEFLSNRTVEWNQRDPANLLCPNDASLGGQTVCGCLPLAMAEILTWFGYPEKGNGTLPSYQIGNTGYTINGYTLNTRYNWAGLQGLQTSSMFYNCQEPLRSNLAQLVYDCGVM
ncbi:MAG: Spi family protease inhibitor, partial [Bacteroidales bacterium]|nr:Spi family protease inhibitor [Bacteroidales bacterium]